MFERVLNIEVSDRQSLFFWGARQTGKSTYLKHKYPDSLYIDLLDNREFIRLSKQPYLLREEVLAASKNVLSKPIIIDEIQKIPALLNEVHWLIENTKAQFFLCGSSAKQLKTNTTNLLGGRAWQYNFYPLVTIEIPEFNLLKGLQHGMIPNHYLAAEKFIGEFHEAYIDVYLTEEIRNEGLVRNLTGFAKFLDVAGQTSGHMLNYNNIARECGIDRKTVQGYYQILLDTLLGYYIAPYAHKVKRDLVSATPKFYLFDVGIRNFLARQQVIGLEGALAGQSFEHFILMELMAYRGINRKKKDITYWRTKTGLEVDFIIGQAEIAIEVKISKLVHQQDLKGLLAFCEDNPKAKAIVVSLDLKPRLLELAQGASILILPYQIFLAQLWNGEIF